MWTKAQVGAFQRALATCARHEEMLSRLEQVSKYAPAFADRVRAIRVMCDNLRMLAQTALVIDSTGGEVDAGVVH